MQRRTFEFQADDLTNDLNASITGLVDAGVYRGFDSIHYIQGGLWIDFNHDITAFPFFDNGTTHGACGLIVTPKGCRVVETTRVRISFSLSNPSVTRAHALVCEHLRVDTQGGNIANYYFQDPTDPINGDMVHIGNLYEFSDGSLIWERNKSRLLGGRSIENENLQKAMWREKSLVASIDARGKIDATEAGSIYEVQGEGKTVYSLPNFKSSLGNKTGASIILKALSDFTISNINPIPVLPFNALEKPIYLGSGYDVLITEGGLVELLEEESFWYIKNIWTVQISSHTLYHRLEHMDDWGFLEKFRDSVHYTLRKKEETLVTNGLIVTSSKNHFLQVSIEAGNEVFGLSQAFKVGSEVTINFVVENGGEAYLRNFIGNSIAKFKTFNSFDGLLKDSCIVKGIQLADRFLVTEFYSLIKADMQALKEEILAIKKTGTESIQVSTAINGNGEYFSNINPEGLEQKTFFFDLGSLSADQGFLVSVQGIVKNGGIYILRFRNLNIAQTSIHFSGEFKGMDGLNSPDLFVITQNEIITRTFIGDKLGNLHLY